MPTDCQSSGSALRNLRRTGRAAIDLVNEFIGAPLFTCVLLLDRCGQLLAEDASITQRRKPTTGEEEAQLVWLSSDGYFVDDQEHFRLAAQLAQLRSLATGPRRQALHFFALAQQGLQGGSEGTPSLEPDRLRLPRIVPVPDSPWKKKSDAAVPARVTKASEVAIFGKFDEAPFPLIGVIPGETEVPEEPADSEEDLKGQNHGARFAWFRRRCVARLDFAVAQWNVLQLELNANGPATDQVQREMVAACFQEGVSPEVLRSRLWLGETSTALDTAIEGPCAWKEVPIGVIAEDSCLPAQEALIKERGENFWEASRLRKRMKLRRADEAFLKACETCTQEPPDRETARTLQRARWQALTDKDGQQAKTEVTPKVSFLEHGKWEATDWGKQREACIKKSQDRLDKLKAKWKERREKPAERDDVMERRRTRERGVPVEAEGVRERLEDAVQRGDLATVERLCRCTLKPRLRGCRDYDYDEDMEDSEPFLESHLILQASTISFGTWPALRNYAKDDEEEGEAATTATPDDSEGGEAIVKSSELSVMLMTGAEITMKVSGRELPHEVRNLVGRALNLPPLAEKTIRFASDEGQLWMHGTLADACGIVLTGAPDQEESHSFTLTAISVQRGSWTATKMVEALLKHIEVEAEELAIFRQEAAAAGNYALFELFLNVDKKVSKDRDWAALLKEASPLFDGCDDLLIQELLIRGHTPGTPWLVDLLSKIGGSSTPANSKRKAAKGLERLAAISLVASLCSPATSKETLESFLQACGNAMWAFLRHHWSHLLEDEDFMLKQLVRSTDKGLRWVSSTLLSSKHFAIRTPLGKDARSFPSLHKSLQTDEEVAWAVIERTPHAAWQVPSSVFTTAFALRIVEKQRDAAAAIPKAVAESPEFLSGLEDLMNRLDTELANTAPDPSSEREHCLRLCKDVLEVAKIFTTRPVLQEIRRKAGETARQKAEEALVEELQISEDLERQVEGLEADLDLAGLEAAQGFYLEACIELKANKFSDLSKDLQQFQEDLKNRNRHLSPKTDILRLVRWLLEGKVTRSLQREVVVDGGGTSFWCEPTGEGGYAELVATEKHWSDCGAAGLFEKLSSVRLAEVPDDVVKAIQQLASHTDLGADKAYSLYPKDWSTHSDPNDARERNKDLKHMCIFRWAQKAIFAFVMLAVNVQPAQDYLEASREELEKSQARAAAIREEVERCTLAVQEPPANEASSPSEQEVTAPRIAQHLMEVCKQEIDLLQQEAVALEQAVEKAKEGCEAAESVEKPLRERAEEQLMQFEPDLELARSRVDMTTKRDLCEIRALKNPPAVMIPVMQATLVLLSGELRMPLAKAKKMAGSPDKKYADWMSIQKSISQPHELLMCMKNVLGGLEDLPERFARQAQQIVDTLTEDDIQRIPKVSRALDMFWHFTKAALFAWEKFREFKPQLDETREACKKRAEAVEEHEKCVAARDANQKRQDVRSALMLEAHQTLTKDGGGYPSKLAQGPPSSWLPRSASNSGSGSGSGSQP